MRNVRECLLEKEKYMIRVDNHIHSGDYNTDASGDVESIILNAEKKNLECFCITNHVWKSSNWIDDYIEKANSLRAKHQVKFLIGVEAKVLNVYGDIDFLLDKYDMEVILGSIHNLPSKQDSKWINHSKLNGREFQNILYETLMNLISNQHIDIIAHPFSIFYEEYRNFSEEYISNICKLAAKKEVAIEIFNSRYMMPISDFRNLVKYCLKYNTLMSIGSDAHRISEIGNLNYQFIYNEIEKQIKL